jgi:hypothetical protein
MQTGFKELSMSDPHDLICVFKAANPSQAELIRNLLEAEGIRAVTEDTHSPFPGLSIMPAEVFVERSNEQAALAIVAEAEKSHAHPQAPDDIGEEFADEKSGT